MFCLPVCYPKNYSSSELTVLWRFLWSQLIYIYIYIYIQRVPKKYTHILRREKIALLERQPCFPEVGCQIFILCIKNFRSVNNNVNNNINNIINNDINNNINNIINNNVKSNVNNIDLEYWISNVLGILTLKLLSYPKTLAF